MLGRIAQLPSLLIIFVLTCMFTKVGNAQPREILNLDGMWNFATDPDNRGEMEKWQQPDSKLPAMPLPGYASTANGIIQVPGIWDNQGYGLETDKVRHNFVGKGWYKRQIEIPQSWAGRRAFLVITGVNRYSKVWVNGQFLGEHIGYLSVQEYDVTPHIIPGKNATITIQVDSKQRWEVDSMFGGSSLADYMDVAWGGIWGHVFLELRSETWLSDPCIQSDVANSSCTVSATCNGKAEAADATKLEILDKNGQRVAEAITKLDAKLAAGQTVSIKAVVPNAALWTPDSPTLYTAKISLLKGGQALDTIENRFGMRQFSINGPYLLLNGRRIMLRGYGDDHIYPEQMSMPSDKELHLKRLRIIQSYGFNHVRHHSTMMPPEYYDACDEVGIITAAEFPIAYSQFLPGTGDLWKSRVAPGTTPAAALATYMREWAAGLTRHRNHPSILCWVMGNELYDGVPLRIDFQHTARTLDPSRFFSDSDGVWGLPIYNGRHIFLPGFDRNTLDLYFTQFDEISGDSIGSPDKYRSTQPKKPMILHEAGNYVMFSRPDLVDQFQHNIKPFWLTAGKAKLEKLGLLQEANLWAEKSERLYALCHKYNLESARLNPYVSGYHWWLFQDYWTTSNGIVDHYFRPKSITKEEVLKYNNEIVLLQSGLSKTYRSRQHLQAKLFVSNYSPAPVQGRLAWKIKSGNQTIASHEISLDKALQGEVAEAVSLDVELPETASPTALKIAADLTIDDKQYTNDWTAWLYPATIQPAANSVPIYAGKTQCNQFKAWGLKPIPADGPLSNQAVYVTDQCDNRLTEAMDRGACVVLLGGAGRFLKSYPVTYRTTWWKAGDSPERNHCGTFVYDHPATRAIAPDGWCDPGWFHLIEGGDKYVLEKTPARPEIIVRALPSMAMVEEDALLFQVGVGKGLLIVSGLNHKQAAVRPENEWLVARLLEYAAGFPRPKSQWPASFLTVVYAAPEGCLPGFDCLASNEGENITCNSYRENEAQAFICRQNKLGNKIAWQTSPLPKKMPVDAVTFVFGGALGYGAQPKTDGFALDINGHEALRFDVPAADRWTSADHRVELRMDVRRTISGDQFGLFFLKVPARLLKPGEPCELGVRSLGTGSQRWFALNPYTDTK